MSAAPGARLSPAQRDRWLALALLLGLLLLALAKLVQPSQVGVWSTAGGNSIAIAWSGSPYLQAEELPGYWLVPVALLASAWCAELTRRVLRALRRGLS